MVVVRPGIRGHGDGSVTVRFPSWLRALLREQFRDFAQLLDRGSAPAALDPLEELTGMRSGPSGSGSSGTGPAGAPIDPVLHRLRPDGYGPDVEEGEAAADFRRFTEADLAALQRQRVASVSDTLSVGDKFELTPEQAQDWLGALNDLRLTLGVVLEVTEDPADAPGPDDPNAQAYEFYGLLGYVQSLLLEALGAPTDL